jgi:hypothetical protein
LVGNNMSTQSTVTYIYVNHKARTIMLAKPATYADLIDFARAEFRINRTHKIVGYVNLDPSGQTDLETELHATSYPLLSNKMTVKILIIPSQPLSTGDGAPAPHPPVDLVRELVLWHTMYEKQMEMRMIAGRSTMFEAIEQGNAPVTAKILQQLQDWHARYDDVRGTMHPGTIQHMDNPRVRVATAGNTPNNDGTRMMSPGRSYPSATQLEVPNLGRSNQHPLPHAGVNIMSQIQAGSNRSMRQPQMQPQMQSPMQPQMQSQTQPQMQPQMQAVSNSPGIYQPVHAPSR